MGDSVWDSIKGVVGKAAPLVGTALGGPAGGAAAGLIADALGVENEPDAINKAMESDPEAATKLQKLQNDHERELRSMVLQAESTRLAEVNKTYRKELESEDGFVRRARPMFLYIVAFSIGVEVLIAVYVVAVGASLSDLATLYQALSIPQGIAAGMCGVYLKKRSDDKALKSGMQPKGLIDSFTERFGSSK